MSETLIALVATAATSYTKRCLDNKPNLSLEDLIRECMRGAIDNGVVTDDDMLFKGACAAAYSLADDAGKEAIKYGLESLRNLSAVMSGVPVDIEALVAEQEERKASGLAVLPLQTLWHEVRGKQ